jgi:hypothetical protein
MPCLERFFSNPRKSDRVECVLSCFRGLPLCWYLPNSPDRVDPRPGSPAASGFFAYGFDQCIQPWAVGRGLAQTYRRRRRRPGRSDPRSAALVDPILGPPPWSIRRRRDPRSAIRGPAVDVKSRSAVRGGRQKSSRRSAVDVKSRAGDPIQVPPAIGSYSWLSAPETARRARRPVAG